MQHGNVIFSLLANICLKFLCDDLNSLRCSSQYCLITVIKISKYYVADDRTLSEKSLAQSWGEILHISRLWFGSDSAGPVIRTVHPEKGSDWSDGDGQSGGEVRDSWPMRSENSEGPGRLWHADSPQPLTWQLQAPPESPQAQMCSPPLSPGHTGSALGASVDREIPERVTGVCDWYLGRLDPRSRAKHLYFESSDWLASFQSQLCVRTQLNQKYLSRESHLITHHGSQEDQQGAQGHQQRPPGPVLRGSSGGWPFPLAGEILQILRQTFFTRFSHSRLLFSVHLSRHTRVVCFSLTSTFPQTTPSSLPNLHSPRESIIQTSTPMEPFVWTFWGLSGLRP